MATDLIARINSLDDFRLLRFFNDFGNKLLQELSLDKERLVQQLPDNAEATITSLASIPKEKQIERLDKKEAVSVARNTLISMANHPNYKDCLEQALNNYTDDEMPAEIILAIGFAASMIIVAATTKIKIMFKDGKIEGEIIKEVAETELVKEVVGPLVDAATTAIAAT